MLPSEVAWIYDLLEMADQVNPRIMRQHEDISPGDSTRFDRLSFEDGSLGEDNKGKTWKNVQLKDISAGQSHGYFTRLPFEGTHIFDLLEMADQIKPWIMLHQVRFRNISPANSTKMIQHVIY